MVIKSYTDYPQSKILSKILSDESADMVYIASANDDIGDTLYTAEYKSEIIIKEGDTDYINCWSLASLLSAISQAQLDSIKQYDKKYWRCCAYFASDWHHSDWCDNPVDACVAMIIKLHELNWL